MSRRIGTANVALALMMLVGALPAAAQQKAPKPGEDITYSLVGKLSKIEPQSTVIVPSALLHIAVDGDVWSINNGGMFSKGGTARAHAKYFVVGLDKAFLQGLAVKAQEDLVERLRAAGFTVKTYADVGSAPEISAHDRFDVDKDYGMPTDERTGINYVIAAPTDEQVFEGGLRTYAWSMKNLAKAQGAYVLMPQYNFRAPQMWGEKGGGYKRNTASIELSPDLTMGFATMFTVNAKQQGGYVRQEGENRLIAEGVGEVDETSKSNYSLTGDKNVSFGATYGEIKGVKASYRFAADRDKYAAGIMHAVTSFNKQLVEELKKQVK
jgi:hypothetical protein